MKGLTDKVVSLSFYFDGGRDLWGYSSVLSVGKEDFSHGSSSDSSGGVGRGSRRGGTVHSGPGITDDRRSGVIHRGSRVRVPPGAVRHFYPQNTTI